MQRVFRVLEPRVLQPSGPKTTSKFNRSVRRYGVLTPILLAEVPDADGVIETHIIDGNRCVRAAQAERLPRIPAVVLKATTAKDRARLTLVCNYLRSNNFHTESDAILTLAQDDAEAEQVAGVLGLGAVKMRQLFQKIDHMPEPVRRAMYEHRLPVTGAQWVSGWPEELQQRACELVEHRRYVQVKELRRLRERYELEHPDAFAPRDKSAAEPASEPFAGTEVWIDPPAAPAEPSPVLPNGDGEVGVTMPDGARDLVSPPTTGRFGPPVPVASENGVVPVDRTAVNLQTPPRDGPAPATMMAPAERDDPAPSAPAVSGEPRVEIARPVATEPPTGGATADGTRGNGEREAQPSPVEAEVVADDPHAFVRRLDAALRDLAQEARRHGIERAVWVDRTFRAWEWADRE